MGAVEIRLPYRDPAGQGKEALHAPASKTLKVSPKFAAMASPHCQHRSGTIPAHDWLATGAIGRTVPYRDQAIEWTHAIYKNDE